MDKVREMVATIVKEKGLNMSALSRAVGKNGTYIQQWIRYGTPVALPESVRHLLARELGISEKSLRVGASIIPSFDPYATDDPPHFEANPAADFPPDAIKELAARPGMGSGQTVETRYIRDGGQVTQRDAVLDDYWRLPPDFVRGDLKTSVANLLVVNCRGDSMEPTLRAGDRLVVDTSDTKPTGDRIFAIRDQIGEIVVKRLRLVGRDPVRIQIVSDNPSVENIEAAFEDVAIVGRVVAGLKLF